MLGWHLCHDPDLQSMAGNSIRLLPSGLRHGEVPCGWTADMTDLTFISSRPGVIFFCKILVQAISNLFLMIPCHYQNQSCKALQAVKYVVISNLYFLFSQTDSHAAEKSPSWTHYAKKTPSQYRLPHMEYCRTYMKKFSFVSMFSCICMREIYFIGNT